jgi:hypothetical protein
VLVLALVTTACGRLGFELLTTEGGSEAPAGGAGGQGGSAGNAAGGSQAARGGSSAGGGLGGGGPSVDAAVGSGGSAGATGPADGGVTPGSDGGHSDSDASGPTCTPQPVLDLCAELPQLRAPAVIDGILDCGLELRTLEPQGWPEPEPPDATAEYAIAWAPGGLYFYILVTDPDIIPPDPEDPIWFGDGVELYVDSDGVSVDGAYDDPGTRQFTVTAPDGITPVRGGRWHNFLPTLDWESSLYGAFPTADGYVVEAFIVAADLDLDSWVLGSGGRVGINIGINVSREAGEPKGDEGYRLGQYFLRVTGEPGGEPFLTQDAFCTPTLLGL